MNTKMNIASGANIVAVNLKTGSGDSYLFLKNDIYVAEDMIAHIREHLGREILYVDDWDIEIIGNISECLMNDCLADAVNGLVDEEDPE